eukprot:6438807-Amphidinium_carterae.1
MQLRQRYETLSSQQETSLGTMRNRVEGASSESKITPNHHEVHCLLGVTLLQGYNMQRDNARTWPCVAWMPSFQNAVAKTVKHQRP